MLLLSFLDQLVGFCRYELRNQPGKSISTQTAWTLCYNIDRQALKRRLARDKLSCRFPTWEEHQAVRQWQQGVAVADNLTVDGNKSYEMGLSRLRVADV